jgi:hypothetical protein
MEGLFDIFESIVMWGAVLFTIGLVIYLGYLQYLKIKRRRARRRHYGRRGTRPSNGHSREHRHSHNQQSGSS